MSARTGPCGGRWTTSVPTATPDHMKRKQTEPQFAVCIDNRGHPASLELRKVYRVAPDPAAAGHGQIRIVDESGEDYLYPQVCFLPIKLPQAAGQAILKAV